MFKEGGIVMICQFTFKNFKSYKNETAFDFQAANLPEFKDSLIKTEKGSDILPLGVIYGPNGGGKTNILQALTYMISLIVKPIYELKKNVENIIIQQEMYCMPFIFDDDSINEPSEFQLFFRKEEYEYRYYIAVCKEIIVEEAFSRKKIGGKKPALIFERNQDSIKLGSIINTKSINKDVNEKMPYFSFLAINYNLPVIVAAQSFFESCIIRNYGNFKSEREMILYENETLKRKIVELMNNMDIDISGYRFDKEKSQFYLQRNINNKMYELSIQEESEGTKKLFVALPILLIALQEGRMVVIDELDAKLHPKLLRYVISMFRNPLINRHGAQLLFTSHDMTTMKNTVFRRDEVWFAAENKNHESEIYSLYEIRNEENERIKNTASYSKQYLEGRYGADPYLSNMISGGDWSE